MFGLFKKLFFVGLINNFIKFHMRKFVELCFNE